MTARSATQERASSGAAPVVIVTGSTRGIGLAIALRFLDAGARVVFSGRRAIDDHGAGPALDAERALCVLGEISDAAARERLFRCTLERFGRLDVLVNNAGVQAFGPLATHSAADFERMLHVNVIAAGDCMRRAVEPMARSGGGCIVNIASIRGVRPGANASLYAASKAALLAMTQAAAVEFGPRKVRVNAILPGLVWRKDLETEWAEGVTNYEALAPLGRIGRPEDIAEACLFLASPAAAWVTGIGLVVDGGMSLVR